LHAAKQSAGKTVKVYITNEMREKIKIVITNSVDAPVDTTRLCKKGVSSKEGHSGFGLYEVRSIVDQLTKEGLYIEFSITCTDRVFTAELLI